MKKAISLQIHGKVQGVYFRQSARQKAQELNISGRVRNCDDGSVEVEAEGEEEDMNKFIEWCHKGPAAALVDAVEIKTTAEKFFNGFEVRK